MVAQTSDGDCATTAYLIVRSKVSGCGSEKLAAQRIVSDPSVQVHPDVCVRHLAFETREERTSSDRFARKLGAASGCGAPIAHIEI